MGCKVFQWIRVVRATPQRSAPKLRLPAVVIGAGLPVHVRCQTPVSKLVRQLVEPLVFVDEKHSCMREYSVAYQSPAAFVDARDDVSTQSFCSDRR